MRNDHITIWEECLRFIKERIQSDQSYKTWFEPIVPRKYADNVLSIQVPSQFFCEWLEENYIGLLTEAIAHTVGREGRLEYIVMNDQGTDNHYQSKPNKSKPASSTQPSPASPPYNALNEGMSLNPSYRFENLIEGDFNRLVKSIGQAIAQNPGKTSFNPFVIYGPVGDGKTHTLHAIGNKIKETHPEMKIAYTSSEGFTNFFVDSLRNNTSKLFRQYYEEIDVLLLDDIQFLTGKTKTQEMLFHIFNQLHQSNKQIVITSDRPPRELQGMENRLLTRFKWGITADLQPPELETRTAIVQSKLAEHNHSLPEELTQYIALNVKTNIRELEGVVNSLMAYLSIDKKGVNLDLIKKIIQDIVLHIDTEISVEYIQKTVADHYKVSLADLKGKCKKREIVTPRQVSMYLIKKYMPDYTLGFIGSHYEGRDHSTVGHSIQVVRDMLTSDKHFKSTVEELDKKINLHVGG